MARRRAYRLRAALAIAMVSVAFASLLPTPPPLSGEASASRFLEVALIGAALLLVLPLREAATPGTASRAAREGPVIVLVFAAWAMLSALWSPIPLTAAVKAMELAAMTLTAQAIVLGAPGRDGAERRQAACDAAALGLVLAVVLLLGVNVVNWGNPLHIAQEELGPFAPPPRPRLALGHAHPLASGLLLALAIAFVVNTSMAFLPKVAVTGALGLLLWLCNARGITVSLGPALLLGAFLTLRPSMLKSWAGFAIVVAGTGAAILALLHLDLSTLVSRGIGEDAGSLNGRTELWAYSFSLALKEALLGVGYYGTRFYLLTLFPFAGHTHNSLLEAFLGTGLPGAALCLSFLLFCVVRLLRTRDPLLGTVLPVVLVEGSLNPVVFIPSVGMFLLMLALFAAHPRGAR